MSATLDTKQFKIKRLIVVNRTHRLMVDAPGILQYKSRKHSLIEHLFAKTCKNFAFIIKPCQKPKRIIFRDNWSNLMFISRDY